jgi:hypothetical protein
MQMMDPGKSSPRCPGAGRRHRFRRAAPTLFCAAAALFCGAIAGPRALADECTPTEPQAELAAARKAGQLVLAGEEARQFLQSLPTKLPVRSADYVFLFMANGAANMAWIDDAASPIAIKCEWVAESGSPLSKSIESALGRSR